MKGQPPIERWEAVLWGGMACFLVGVMWTLFSIRGGDGNMIPAVIGSVIGLVCFVLSLRGEED
jgi:hypothetical protein